MKIDKRRWMESLAALLLLASAGGLLTGCGSTSKSTPVAGPSQPPQIRTDSRIYVSMPFDALSGKNVAVESGRQTAEAIATALSRYNKRVFMSKIPLSLVEGMEAARKIQAEYMVYPTIIEWRDRATEWSGRRDVLKVRIDLIEVSTEQRIYGREIEARSKWMTDGGDRPGDLLADPAGTFASDLFMPPGFKPLR